ncbi:MAG: histone deacetylase [Acidiferrobacteraceae bacterium]|nr:histone deacetylase [Acidiferrobacteraceae bacterium]
MNTGFLSDERFLLHDTGKSHPERPARMRSVLDHIREFSWFETLLPITAETCDEKWLTEVHDMKLVQRARETCANGGGQLDSPDVQVSTKSFDTALLAAGGVMRIADAVMSGQVNNGFALVRPPGHHAERSEAMGFCLFNNVAIATRYLQKQYGLDKILIVDWDVHHGNGTQHIFEQDPSVLYVSLHQYPHYPGTGASSETGVGSGVGATLNCPMHAGSGDNEYEQAFREVILPFAYEFKPDAVVISAGFDAHQTDPLGDINLSTDFYGWMTTRLLEVADSSSEGRLISVLEGGYNLKGLSESVAKHISVLLDDSAAI